jgi:hypothetical protein
LLSTLFGTFKCLFGLRELHPGTIGWKNCCGGTLIGLWFVGYSVGGYLMRRIGLDGLNLDVQDRNGFCNGLLILFCWPTCVIFIYLFPPFTFQSVVALLPHLLPFLSPFHIFTQFHSSFPKPWVFFWSLWQITAYLSFGCKKMRLKVRLWRLFNRFWVVKVSEWGPQLSGSWFFLVLTHYWVSYCRWEIFVFVTFFLCLRDE